MAEKNDLSIVMRKYIYVSYISDTSILRPKTASKMSHGQPAPLGRFYAGEI